MLIKERSEKRLEFDESSFVFFNPFAFVVCRMSSTCRDAFLVSYLHRSSSHHLWNKEELESGWMRERHNIEFNFNFIYSLSIENDHCLHLLKNSI